MDWIAVAQIMDHAAPIAVTWLILHWTISRVNAVDEQHRDQAQQIASDVDWLVRHMHRLITDRSSDDRSVIRCDYCRCVLLGDEDQCPSCGAPPTADRESDGSVSGTP